MKKVLSAHQRQKLNKYALLEHTKMKQAKQRARIVLLGRTIQNKGKHLVNLVKKVLSAHQRQKLIKNAVLEHTKMNQAKQRAKIVLLGSMVQNKAKQLKKVHALNVTQEK